MFPIGSMSIDNSYIGPQCVQIVPTLGQLEPQGMHHFRKRGFGHRVGNQGTLGREPSPLWLKCIGEEGALIASEATPHQPHIPWLPKGVPRELCPTSRGELSVKARN